MSTIAAPLARLRAPAARFWALPVPVRLAFGLAWLGVIGAIGIALPMTAHRDWTADLAFQPAGQDTAYLTVHLHPADAASLGVGEGEQVRVVSRRGAVEAPVRLDPGLRPGLAFMTFHFPDDVPTNWLTIDTYDPKSGTAEFKATPVFFHKPLAISRSASVANCVVAVSVHGSVHHNDR